MMLITWSRQLRRTDWSLMVMPRSRSSSIESRYCARMSRSSTAPVSSSRRSDNVVLPWSMWAMTAMSRRRDRSMIAADRTNAGCDIGFRGHYPVPAVLGVDSGILVANIKSQIKRNRQNEKRHARNKAVRSELKTRMKRAINAAQSGDENATAEATLAVKRLDKAAAKGII